MRPTEGSEVHQLLRPMVWYGAVVETDRRCSWRCWLLVLARFEADELELLAIEHSDSSCRPFWPERFFDLLLFPYLLPWE